MKKYDKDLNTTLIFVSILSFSRICLNRDSNFAGGVGPVCSPPSHPLSFSTSKATYNLITSKYHQLLTAIASVSPGNAPTENAAISQWTGPDPTVVHVQAILYFSLAAPLLAAFVAMLGKQWLNRYAQVEMRGSVIDRSRHRQRKMKGIVTWHFDFVMECLPLMLQAALLLLVYALSNYLFFINKAVAGVLIGFTAFGLLFYLLIVSTTTLSYNCPFQTPASLILRFLIRFDGEHKKYIRRTREWFKVIFSRTEKGLSRPKYGGPHGFSRSGTVDGANPEHIELPMANTANQPTPLFNKETGRDGYVLDSNCIAWMFEMSMDTDVIMAIMRLIPEVVWYAGIRTTTL